MKANNGSGNNPLRDGWETPKELFDTLNSQYAFNLDCCADESNNKTLLLEIITQYQLKLRNNLIKKVRLKEKVVE